MKRLLHLSVLLLAFSSLSTTDSYWTSSFGDFVFSYSNIESSQFKSQPKVRVTAWLHFSQFHHYDFNKRLGMYTGSSVRNVGLIYEYEDADEVLHKVKQRAYMFGVPVAFKFGNMEESKFGYVGAEMEVAFHYKEKHFESSVKTSKESEWFSSKTNLLQPSVYIGWQSGDKWNICAKWYLRDFLNSDYSRGGANPVDYSVFSQSQIFYIAISTHIKSKELKLDKKSNDPKFATR